MGSTTVSSFLGEISAGAKKTHLIQKKRNLCKFCLLLPGFHKLMFYAALVDSTSKPNCVNSELISCQYTVIITVVAKVFYEAVLSLSSVHGTTRSSSQCICSLQSFGIKKRNKCRDTCTHTHRAGESTEGGPVRGGRLSG